jgi:hypothetical protein
MAKTYYTFFSAEEAGAETPNIIGIENPDGTVLEALDGIIAGDLMSTSEALSESFVDHFSDYPAGNQNQAGYVLEGATSSLHVKIWDLNADANSKALINAIVAAGYKIPGSDESVVRVLAARR